MTDTGREYALTGDHAENLHSGAMLAPGERVTDAELDPDGADLWLVEEGRLVEVAEPDPPSLRELKARAKTLGIEGRSKMGADELQQAIQEAERPIIAAADEGVAQGDAGKDGS